MILFENKYWCVYCVLNGQVTIARYHKYGRSDYGFIIVKDVPTIALTSEPMGVYEGITAGKTWETIPKYIREVVERWMKERGAHSCIKAEEYKRRIKMAQFW